MPGISEKGAVRALSEMGTGRQYSSPILVRCRLAGARERTSGLGEALGWPG
jgi:hypothetical protein